MFMTLQKLHSDQMNQTLKLSPIHSNLLFHFWKVSKKLLYTIQISPLCGLMNCRAPQ